LRKSGRPYKQEKGSCEANVQRQAEGIRLWSLNSAYFREKSLGEEYHKGLQSSAMTKFGSSGSGRITAQTLLMKSQGDYGEKIRATKTLKEESADLYLAASLKKKKKS